MQDLLDFFRGRLGWWRRLGARRRRADFERDARLVDVKDERDAGRRGGGAMFDGECEVLAVAAQVEVRIAPGVKLGAAAQRLAVARLRRALARVVDDDDGKLVA